MIPCKLKKRRDGAIKVLDPRDGAMRKLRVVSTPRPKMTNLFMRDQL